MTNATWVCFDCREAMRRPTQHAEAVPCPRCGVAARGLGTKVRIPPKGDDRAWRAFRASFRERRLAALERLSILRVRDRHELERRIATLESRASTEGRDRLLRELRRRLAAFANPGGRGMIG